MGNSIVKTVLGLLVLIIASFLIGILAADSAKTAAMLVFGLGALFFIVAIWMFLMRRMGGGGGPVGGGQRDPVRG